MLEPAWALAIADELGELSSDHPAVPFVRGTQQYRIHTNSEREELEEKAH